MIKRTISILSVVALIVIATGCSPDNSEELNTIEEQRLEISQIEERLVESNAELKRVVEELESASTRLTLTEKSLKERDESIERLNNRIAELESMIDFPEPDYNKKNYTGIGDTEFMPIPIQNKDSKGDSDFD